MLVCWILFACVCEWLLDVIKRLCLRRISLSKVILWLVLRILAKKKASLTKPFDHTAPIYMIIVSRAWLGWLLHYYLHCPLIDASCLIRILLFVYALTWVCICDMIFTWLLNAWVIWLIMGHSDDGYGWGRVSATIGVALCSSAIMMIDLSRRNCWRIKDYGCVNISPNLGSYNHSTLYGQGIG
jgi:hypothetical protein